VGAADVGGMRQDCEPNKVFFLFVEGFEKVIRPFPTMHPFISISISEKDRKITSNLVMYLW